MINANLHEDVQNTHTEILLFTLTSTYARSKDENGTEISRTDPHRFIYLIDRIRIFGQIRIRFEIRNIKFKIGTKTV